MKLSFNVFGIEVATIELDLPEGDKQSVVESVVEKTVGTTTKWWLGKLFR